MMSRFVISMILFILLSCGYGGGERSDFARIDSLTNVSPREALALLDNINPDSLSDSERHRYDLLTIKARDKAYIVHTSDSLILDVIDYYSSHRRNGLLPEALYYGGRVYSDLGDYPTALHYFQDALDIIPDDAGLLKFKGTVNSQTGRLFNNLRLYSDAIPYIKKAIKINHQTNDSVCLAYNYQLLGSTYNRKGDLDSAELAIQTALSFSHKLTDEDRARIVSHLASIQLKKGRIDSAFILIRDVPNLIKSRRNYAIAIAADTYLKAGITDTAYIYARQLVDGPEDLNRKVGYQLLLSPALIKYIPRDSVVTYSLTLKRIMEEYLERNNAESVIAQNSMYNYQKHYEARIEAEKTRDLYLVLALVCVCLILIVVIVTLKVENNRKREIIALRKSLDKLEELDLNRLTSNVLPSEETILPNKASDWENYNINDLKDRLKKQIALLSKEAKDYVIPSEITESETYKSINDIYEKSKVIREDSDLWNELEGIVTKVSPLFIKKLNLLVHDLPEFRLHLALLIKCGFTPSQCVVLLGKEKGTISYHRRLLLPKYFGKNTSAKDTDLIIRLL